MTDTSSPAAAPVRQRIVAIDALRGFALLGIALANYPEFSLYNFLGGGAQTALPYSAADDVLSFLIAALVDGKFYTIFSLLFGMGFAIILGNARTRGADGMRIFYRRMLILAIVGACHLMFIWSGDILLLYALMGMLLPLFYGMSDRRLLTWAGALLALPVAIAVFRDATGLRLPHVMYTLWWDAAEAVGITDATFATWLRDARSYADVWAFLKQGAVERMWEFVSGCRYFKVLGLFLVGFYVGRRGILADVEGNKKLLRRAAIIGLGVGLPLSLIYAVSVLTNYIFGNVTHAVLYLVSVYPLGVGYVALFTLACHRFGASRLLAVAGRMALTCYIGQSLIGAAIFYGPWGGLGASVSLGLSLLTACAVVVAECLFCKLWLRWFAFGPLEWVWRMLTYGRWFSIVKR